MPSTGIAIVDWALGAMSVFGYLIVFVATVFENVFVLGSFTPGELIVIAGAFVSSQPGAQIWWGGVWMASVLGTLVGSNISYWVGHRAGRSALERVIARAETSRVGKLFRVSSDSIRDSEQYFIDHGAKTVLFARFAAGVKNFVPLIAGVSRMSVFWFEVYTLLGAVVYTSAMVAIGYFVGSNFGLALRIAGSIGWAGLLVIAILFAAVLWGRRQARLRKEERELNAVREGESDEIVIVDDAESGVAESFDPAVPEADTTDSESDS